jgi:hypothetical protein
MSVSGEPGHLNDAAKSANGFSLMDKKQHS